MNQIIQISYSDFQQAIHLLLWAFLPLCLVSFMFGAMAHDFMCHWLDVFFRVIRRRQFRNKLRS